jgi:Na+/melibiose symporter-like transporter
VIWLLFIWRISKAHEPLIPLSILGNDVVSRATVAAACGMGAYIGLSIYLPVYFQSVRGLSASDSGLGLIPLMVGTVIGATIAGQLMGRIRHYKRIPAIGLFISMLGAGVLTVSADSLPLALFEIVLAVISIGLGTVLPTTTVAIQNAVELHQLGIATGTMNFFRQLGSAITVAIFGALLNASGISAADIDASATLPAGSFTSIFAATSIGFAVAFLFILWMKERPLRASARHAAEAVTAD